jgi:hypothetical protein
LGGRILNHILYRKPAFNTLRPNLPEFIPVDRNELSSLQSCVGPGQLLRRKYAYAGMAGYYLHRNGNGDTAFLKVVPITHTERQRAADVVAGWIARFGVCTPILLPGFPRTICNEYAVFAYKYIAGRFANSTASDLNLIGSNLAAMHTALARFPEGPEIRIASAARNAMLINRRNLICSGVHSPGPNPAQLREILETEDAIFSLLEDETGHQPVHGDLVYGNILFSSEGDSLVLLDFEDALISWLPVDMDIALALERFVLLPEQNDEKALALGRGMLQAYRLGSGRKSGFLVHPLSDCLRLLSVRALTTIAEMEARGEAVDVAEWDKFFMLYRHAMDRASLLATLQDEFFT